jgi:hypothetical protein
VYSLKSFVLMARYYLRVFRNGLMRFQATILFFTAAVLFTVVMVPRLRQRLCDAGIGQCEVRSYRVAGLVLQETRDARGKVTRTPLAGVAVQAGGFRTFTDSSGAYELGFWAQDRNDIPFILRGTAGSKTEWISVPGEQTKFRKDFLF